MAATDPAVLAMISAVRNFMLSTSSQNPPREVKTEIEKIRAHARDRARANAPILTGALRKSIDVDVRPEKGQLSFDFVSDRDYVIQTHEEQHRQLGPRSAAEPSTPEGGVGSKYFTRVVDRWGDIYMDQLMLSIIKSMGGTER